MLPCQRCTEQIQQCLQRVLVIKLFTVITYTPNGTPSFNKCKQLFECQHLLLLRYIPWSKFLSIFKYCSFFSTSVLVRQLWLKTVVFPHCCLIRAVLYCIYLQLLYSSYILKVRPKGIPLGWVPIGVPTWVGPSALHIMPDQAQCYKTFYRQSLLMFRISLSVFSWPAFPA